MLLNTNILLRKGCALASHSPPDKLLSCCPLIAHPGITVTPSYLGASAGAIQSRQSEFQNGMVWRVEPVMLENRQKIRLVSLKLEDLRLEVETVGAVQKEVTSQLSFCVIPNWCSERSSDFRVAHILEEKQKERVHKRRKKRHCSDARIPRLKGTNRDELAKIPRTEKQAFGLRNNVEVHPQGKEQMGHSRMRAAGGGGRSWVRNCK